MPAEQPLSSCQFHTRPSREINQECAISPLYHDHLRDSPDKYLRFKYARSTNAWPEPEHVGAVCSERDRAPGPLLTQRESSPTPASTGSLCSTRNTQSGKKQSSHALQVEEVKLRKRKENMRKDEDDEMKLRRRRLISQVLCQRGYRRGGRWCPVPASDGSVYLHYAH